MNKNITYNEYREQIYTQITKEDLLQNPFCLLNNSSTYKNLNKVKLLETYINLNGPLNVISDPYNIDICKLTMLITKDVIEIIKLLDLISKKNNTNIFEKKDYKGRTTLFFACEYCYKYNNIFLLIEYLIKEKKVECNTYNNDNIHVIKTIIKNKNISTLGKEYLIKIFLQNNLFIYSLDNYNNSLLHLLSSNKYLFTIFLPYQKNINILNKKKFTPLELFLIKNNNYNEIIKLLFYINNNSISNNLNRIIKTIDKKQYERTVSNYLSYKYPQNFSPN